MRGRCLITGVRCTSDEHSRVPKSRICHIDSHRYTPMQRIDFRVLFPRNSAEGRMKRRSFKALGFGIWLTLHGYQRRRDLNFFRAEDFEGRSYYIHPIYNELLAELGRSLSKLAFEMNWEGDQSPAQDAERLLHAVQKWHKGLRKRARRKRAAPRIAA